MYDYLINRLNEKFPEKTFKVEKDDSGSYTLFVDEQFNISWRTTSSNDDPDTIEGSNIILDYVSQTLQYIKGSNHV